MNKLIQVNIGGIVFQIDEQAYHQLDAYLNSIKKKYASVPDGDEIVKDVEARIAELFTEKFNGANGAIMQKDVDDIIGVMGKVEEYETVSGQKEHASAGEQTRRATRFYRDKDNNVLGGVCAGFAAKFDIDALWIRLAFLVVFFFAGTGLLLYIILWIIIPEAKTTTEKLEMRGEKINLSNIEKTVKQGATQFKTHMNEFGQEVKDTFSKENLEKSKRNAGDFIESAVETLKPAFRAIAKIIVFAVLIVSLIIVVAVLVELFVNSKTGMYGMEFLGSHITGNSTEALVLVFCAVALLLIPLFGIIFSSMKYLLGIRTKTKFVSMALGFLWTASLIVVIYLGITIGRDFRYESSVNGKALLQNPSTDVMHIRFDGPKYNPAERWGDKHGRHYFFEMHDDSVVLQQIHLEVVKNEDTVFQVLVNKSARGFSNEDARSNAAAFQFVVANEPDSILTIPSTIQLLENEQWRGQEVFVTIRVPAGKRITIDDNASAFFETNEFTGDVSDQDLFTKELMMTSNGLKTIN